MVLQPGLAWSQCLPLGAFLLPLSPLSAPWTKAEMHLSDSEWPCENVFCHHCHIYLLVTVSFLNHSLRFQGNFILSKTFVAKKQLLSLNIFSFCILVAKSGCMTTQLETFFLHLWRTVCAHEKKILTKMMETEEVSVTLNKAQREGVVPWFTFPTFVARRMVWRLEQPPQTTRVHWEKSLQSLTLSNSTLHLEFPLQPSARERWVSDAHVLKTQEWRGPAETMRQAGRAKSAPGPARFRPVFCTATSDGLWMRTMANVQLRNPYV